MNQVMAPVTVVCPAYNSAHFIAETLRSILSQTLMPTEVFVVDDGSTDDTVAIVSAMIPEFAGRGCRLVVGKQNHLGPGQARNAAIAKATQPWVAFLDSDDIWMSDKIARVMALASGRPSVNAIVHWEKYRRLDGHISILQHGTPYDQEKDLPRAIYRANRLSTSAVTIRRDELLAVGKFDATLLVSQDFDLWLRLSPKMMLATIAEPLGIFVERATSITAKPYWRRIGPLLRIYLRHRRKAGPILTAEMVARAMLSRQWLALLRPHRQGHAG